jgi:outer membrane protein assembly factor BamB
MLAAPVAVDPAPAVLPLDVAWTYDFAFSAEFSIVMGDSRVLVVEPTQMAAHAWQDGAPLWTSQLVATALPTVSEGRVFVPTEQTLNALSEVSGFAEWSLPIGRVSTTPAARGGWVVAAGDDGVLRGVTSSTGQVIWERLLLGILSTAIVIDGDLIVGGFADGTVTGWRITDGQPLWTTEIGARPVQLLAASGRVFVAGHDGHLISLRPRDGYREWRYAFGMPIVGRLAADSRHVYAMTIDNAVRAHQFNGNQRWRQEVASRVVGGLFVDSDSVFVPQSNGEVRMYRADAKGTRSGRLAGALQAANVLGGLVTRGTGDDLRLAIAMSTETAVTVTAYQRTGLNVTVALDAPTGPALTLTVPPGRH